MARRRATTGTLFDMGSGVPAAKCKTKRKELDLTGHLRGILADVTRAELENDEFEWVSVSRVKLLKIADLIGR